MATGYKVNGQNLNNLFYPLSSGGTSQVVNTNFRTLNSSTMKYSDLITSFAAYIPNTTPSTLTNFYVDSYVKDLNQIFQNINVPPDTLLKTVTGNQALCMLAIDKDGNLYYSNSLTSTVDSSSMALTIYKYTPSTNSVSTLISTAASSNQFVSSIGITFDSSGDLYIASWPSSVNANSCIFKYTLSSDTPTLSKYINGNNLNKPMGISFDGQGNIYVCNLGNNTVYKYDNTTVATKIKFITSGGSTIAINQPYGLAFDSSGNLYVGNLGANQVIKYTPSTGISSVFYSSSGMQPYGLTFDSNDNLYINDFNYALIKKISTSGNVIYSYSVYSAGGRPTGSAINKDGYIYFLYISGDNNYSIYMY